MVAGELWTEKTLVSCRAGFLLLYFLCLFRLIGFKIYPTSLSSIAPFFLNAVNVLATPSQRNKTVVSFQNGPLESLAFQLSVI